MIFTRFFWKHYLRLKGWAIQGSYPYHLPKLVVAVAPHTSGRDFIIGLAVRSTLGIQHIRFLGKQELFKPPFGFVFRWLGGTPVDRFSSKNMVEQVVDCFNQNERFTIALSPEGTRKRVQRLRTGFYHIALGAGAPILMVAFDFGAKKVVIAEPFMPTGNFEDDAQKMLSFWGPVQGYHHQNGLGHLQGNPVATGI